MRARTAVLACAAAVAGALPTVAQSDRCDDAPFLTDGEYVFSTMDATTEYPERLMCGTDRPLQFDIWLRYTAACDSYLQLIFHDVTTELDVVFYSDADCPLAGPADCRTVLPGQRWAVATHVTAGHTQLVQIGSLRGARSSGAFTLVCGAEDPACQPYIRGDFGDGSINSFDIDALVMAVSDPDLYRSAMCNGSADCVVCRGDLNDDGRVNNFDIDAFVRCVNHLPAPGLPCP